jgi:methionine-rich copper-binding protein CopC
MRRLLPTFRAAAVAVLLPGSALAFHLKLLRSDPAEDAVLARPPAAVRLWFSQRAEAAVTRVRLVGPRGTVALGGVERYEAAAEGEVPRMPTRPGRAPDAPVGAAVRGAMPPGPYTLEWRTMSADGHPVSGRVAFRVAPPAPAR